MLMIDMLKFLEKPQQGCPTPIVYDITMRDSGTRPWGKARSCRGTEWHSVLQNTPSGRGTCPKTMQLDLESGLAEWSIPRIHQNLEFSRFPALIDRVALHVSETLGRVYHIPMPGRVFAGDPGVTTIEPESV